MSRSYKKVPYATDGKAKTTKESKRFANKRVRKSDNIPSKGSSYKKVYPSWDIHDYKSYWPWDIAKKEYEEARRDVRQYLLDHYPTLKDFYRFWLKYYSAK